jgi:hypothetical protein
VVPAAQIVEHVPPLQTCPDAHFVPQVPQLFGSVVLSVQAAGVPHATSGAAHDAEQLPPPHVEPAGQAFDTDVVEHAPQLRLSVFRSWHLPSPHSVCPVTHDTEHAPAEHTVPPLHATAVEHAVPHFALSVERSRHLPSPQSTVPVAQVLAHAPAAQT